MKVKTGNTLPESENNIDPKVEKSSSLSMDFSSSGNKHKPENPGAINTGKR